MSKEKERGCGATPLRYRRCAIYRVEKGLPHSSGDNDNDGNISKQVNRANSGALQNSRTCINKIRYAASLSYFNQKILKKEGRVPRNKSKRSSKQGMLAAAGTDSQADATATRPNKNADTQIQQ
eukprot:jgi/Psemu1/28454/gm1.28454_g